MIITKRIGCVKMIEEKNILVVVRTIKAKKVFYRIGKASLEEAREEQNRIRLELLRSGKDRYYEVIIGGE